MVKITQQLQLKPDLKKTDDIEKAGDDATCSSRALREKRFLKNYKEIYH